MRSILIHVTGDRLGDALLKLPVLRAFRQAHPDTWISWVTGKRPSIFAGRLKVLVDGLIDEIHEATGLGQSLFEVVPAALRGRYDMVVSTESRLRDTLALRRLRADAFISPAAKFLFSSRRAGPGYAQASSYEQFRILLSLAGNRELVPTPNIDLPTDMLAAAGSVLPDGPRYAGLSPGAGGKSKIWPLQNYVALANWLLNRGFIVVFFLGPEESDLRVVLAESVPRAMFPESAPTIRDLDSPLTTIALARRMQFSVTNDSGGGHLIAAGGRPTVTLYGHTSARKFASPYCVQIPVCAEEYGGRSLAELSTETVRGAITAAGLLDLP